MPFVVIEAPTELGLKREHPDRPMGVVRLPDALRRAGFPKMIGASDGVRIVPPPYDASRNPPDRVLNLEGIHSFSEALAKPVEENVRGGRVPVVLGGDCSVLLGSLLGLKRIGRFGLAFIDGHSDFYTPATSSTGGVAGMDLAIACGRAVERLATLAAPEPLIVPEDVVLLGRRDIEEARAFGGEPDGAVQDWPLHRVRDAGLRNATKQVIEHFRSREVEGVWVHIDADVLHDDLMPAVDSRQPDGMTYGELSGILAALMKSCRVAGVEVTIFDPDKDPTGSIARELTAALARGLNATSPAREQRM